MAQRLQDRLRSHGSCGKALRLPHEQSLLVGRDLAARYLRLRRQVPLRWRNARVQPCLQQPRLHGCGVLAQQEPVLDQAVDGTDHRTVVLPERRITLLDRRARIARRDARFHLVNGARLARLNWLGDTSATGMRQSAGMMVNYVYRLAEVERNHEAYARDRTVVTSRRFELLARESLLAKANARQA